MWNLTTKQPNNKILFSLKRPEFQTRCQLDEIIAIRKKIRFIKTFTSKLRNYNYWKNENYNLKQDCFSTDYEKISYFSLETQKE